MLKECKITVDGSVGYLCASLLDGPDVTINGNAGWALGENMMSGRITLTRSAGRISCRDPQGWTNVRWGDAGARAGISMKGGDLIIRGNAGFLTGYMMQKGRIIICGDVGDAVGDSMYEGEIYVAGNIGSLGSDAKEETASEDELLQIWETLQNFGISERFQFKKVVSAKKLYHFDALERFEKRVV